VALVKGHSGDLGNERAEALANVGAALFTEAGNEPNIVRMACDHGTVGPKMERPQA
jgi:hypothetical protein